MADGTILERLEAVEGRLAAESAMFVSAMRRVVETWNRTPEPGVRKQLEDELSELQAMRVAMEQRRRHALTRIDEARWDLLQERMWMEESFEERYSEQPIRYVHDGSCVLDRNFGRRPLNEPLTFGLHEANLPLQPTAASHPQVVYAAQPPAHSAASHSFGQPYFQAEPAETAAPFGSLFDQWHSQPWQHSQQQPPCFGQQPMLVPAAEVGSFPEQRLQQRVAHLGQPPLHEQRAYDGYDSDGLQQLDLGTHARMPHKGALATKRQKSCVCGLWLYCGCGGYGSGPSSSEFDSDDGSGDDDSDSDLDPRSSDGSSKRLKPTHPQPTEVSECLCPASHRREYYSDDFAGGGGC